MTIDEYTTLDDAIEMVPYAQDVLEWHGILVEPGTGRRTLRQAAHAEGCLVEELVAELRDAMQTVTLEDISPWYGEEDDDDMMDDRVGELAWDRVWAAEAA